MTSILTVLAGLLVRIALPALLMLALVFLLRHLDAHWQEEALELQRTEAIERHEHTWDLKNCSLQKMQTSSSIRSKDPCWQLFRDKNGNLHEECLACKVFRATPVMLSE